MDAAIVHIVISVRELDVEAGLGELSGGAGDGEGDR